MEWHEKRYSNFVAKCTTCQQVKVENQRPGGMMQEFSIPTWKWEEINMDFVIGLPPSRCHHDSIWVVVDRLTKSAHFLPIHTSYTAEDYARLYIRELVRLHRVPLSIILDRGTQFTSQFWRFRGVLVPKCILVPLFIHRLMVRLRGLSRLWRIC